MRKSKTIETWGIVALALCGLAVLLIWRAAAVEAVYPVERARASFARRVWARCRGLWRASSAMAENVRLRRELEALALERGEAGRVWAENVRLRQALGYLERERPVWLAAEVLSAGGGAAGVHATLRAGRGSLAGVAPGAAVAVPEGLVGRVAGVTPHTCEVQLLAGPQSAVACETVAADGETVYGVVSGVGGGELEMRYVRSDAAILPRAEVITSGLGGAFPRGLTVGYCLGDADGGGAASGGRRLRLQAAVAEPEALADVFIRK